ncbi:MAG: hypothetical protein O3C40_04450 [Planctomycetota bacterium]|nr:hypothetical protein [Planctomycetota bacterium]
MLCSPKTLLAGTLSLPLLLAAALGAEGWPQWRGMNRDGVCGETGFLQSFPVEGLKVRWRVPVGWGFSSLVVAQGYLARIFGRSSQVAGHRRSSGLRRDPLYRQHRCRKHRPSFYRHRSDYKR